MQNAVGILSNPCKSKPTEWESISCSVGFLYTGYLMLTFKLHKTAPANPIGKAGAVFALPEDIFETGIALQVSFAGMRYYDQLVKLRFIFQIPSS